MKKELIVSILLLTISLHAFSQVDNSYSLYQYNTNIINPAYAGSHETLDVGIMNTWSHIHVFGSYKDQPTTFTLNVHSPISKGFGVGFYYENTKMDFLKGAGYTIDISYKHEISEEATLALGVNFGKDLFKTSFNQNYLSDVYDGIDDTEFLIKNIGTGVYFKKNNLYTGLAYTYFFGEYIMDIGDSQVISKDYSISVVNGFIGFLIEISENVKLKPVMQIINNSYTEDTWVYISANVFFKDDLEFGIHYSFSRAVAFSLNTPLIFNTFKLGVNVDFLNKEKSFYQTQSLQNLSLFTNFYIDAFKKKTKKIYF